LVEVSHVSLSFQPPSHGHDLARVILERSEGDGFAPGGRLPTERRLATELGVSRTAIRHALAVLEAEGLVSREVGRGTFLRPDHAAGSSRTGNPPAQIGPADVMEARRLIEPQVLPLVVAWATQQDFDEMRRCLAGGAAADNATEFETWDFALHHAIVAAGRNGLIGAMYRLIEQAREGELWGNLKRRNDSRERREIYQAEHVALVDALAARELDEATRVMNAHLARVTTNLLDSAGLTTPRPAARPS
jgi:GntR family uxuAB operon transcriptional repressor